MVYPDSYRFNIFPELVTESWPLIDVKFLLITHIFRMNRWNLTIFCTCIETRKSKLGLLCCLPHRKYTLVSISEISSL